MELKKLLEVLRRRKWLAIQAFLVIFLAAVMGTFLLTPAYTAWAKFYIKKMENPAARLSTLGLTELSSLIPPSSDAAVNQALATSRPMMERMIANLQLRNDIGELRRPDEVLKSSLLSLLIPRPYVEVIPLPDTPILQIWATSTDPQEAAMMANTLAELMVEESRRETREEYRSAMSFIAEQLESVKAQYDRSLEALKAFQEQERTVSLGTEKQLAVQKLGDLLKQKEDNIIDLAEARAKLETLKRQLSRQTGDAAATSALSQNPQIRTLKDRLSELEIQLTGAAAEFTEKAPQVKALRQQIALVKAQLTKELRTYQGSALEAEALERDIAALTVHLKGVDEAIDKFLTSFFNTLPEKSARQARLELGVTSSQRVYESLLDYRNQLGVAEAAALSNLRILDPAAVPLEPSRPNKLVNAVVGAFLGLFMAVGLAVLQEYMDDTLKTPDDIQDESKLTVLGIIPRLPPREEHSIASRSPADAICEAYRTLRNNLKFASLDRPLKSFMITSATLAEGKTTTVCNLGISIAREGKKVLLIDTDLRHPQLHTVLKQVAPLGLCDVLVGEAELARVICETEIEGLFFLPCGSMPPDPAQMVESMKMRALITDLLERFDIVILDSPPLLPVSDAAILGGYVDGTLILMESGRVTRQMMKTLKERIEATKLRVVGIALNKLRVERSRSYYYGGYYYSSNGGRNGRDRMRKALGIRKG